jgi:predicted amidophosphoribosyltransferase
LKYDGRLSLAGPLSAAMRDAGHDVLAGADAAVPVPLHPWREWRRGFNQAEALARGLGPPVLRMLCRIRYTRAQATLSAGMRRQNVRNAFAPAPLGRWPAAVRWLDTLQGLPWRSVERRLEGTCVVLVDDVATTGATLEACASVLRAAGVREVRALTAARAVTGRR